MRNKKTQVGSKEKRILLEVTSTQLSAVGKLNGPGLGVLWQHLARLSLHILPHCCFLQFGLVSIAGHYLKIHQVSFLAGMGKKDDPKLMQEWFKLVQEKNALVRYESELMIL